jgi:hypothetical protein
MKRILIAASVLLAATVQAAVVWTPVKPTDCTAAATPTACCVVAQPGANPACMIRNTAGTLTLVHADIKSDGGTYTAGGDTLTTAGFGLLGLGSVIYTECVGSTGQVVIPSVDATGKLVKFKLYTTAGTEATGAIAATVFLTCDFYGR